MDCPDFAYYLSVSGVGSLVDDIAGICTGYGSRNSIMGVALISAVLVFCDLVFHSKHAMPYSNCV